MNLYFRDFSPASFREAEAPFYRQWGDMDKLQGMALWQDFRRTGYAEATIRYQIVIGIDETCTDHFVGNIVEKTTA